MPKYRIKFGLYDKTWEVNITADDRYHAEALARLELKARGVKFWWAEGIRAWTEFKKG